MFLNNKLINQLIYSIKSNNETYAMREPIKILNTLLRIPFF